MSEKTVDLNEMISRDYNEFLDNLSELLTFVPEGQRRDLIERFILGVLRS